MKNLAYFLICTFLLIQSCIEDPDIFAVSSLRNDTSSEITIIIMSMDSSFTMFQDTLGRGGYTAYDGRIENFLNSSSSIEIINNSTNESVIYYHPTINNDNFQNYNNETLFKVDNWEDLGNYEYLYHVTDSDFD